ncbi:MAG TPA: PepSY-associated TM helix domain-containing protein [Longimicrobiales bacterium]|nr:PepSY-associated TM helix domain-containing protein [Longimicrobiales bacterium]
MGTRSGVARALRRLRTVIFWLHLTAGLSAAAIILTMSVTGVLLTYQRQIQAWADTRGLDAGPPAVTDATDETTGAPTPLSPEALLERVAATHPGTVTSVRWSRDPAAPVEVALGRDVTLFVNGYTGSVLGDGSERTRAFFRTVLDWHRWLGLKEDLRPRGRAVTGAANLLFLFIVIAGVYLWWPRNVTRRSFRSVLVFRTGLRGKARDFNWHNVIGIWSVVPLIIVIASGVVISYAIASAAVARLAGWDAPAAMMAPAPTAGPSAGVTARSSPDREPVPPADMAPADTMAPQAFLLGRARAQMPDWRWVTVRLPVRDGRVVYTLDGGYPGQPQKRAQVTLSAATGDVVSWDPFSSQARAQRVRSILRYAHTGEVLGLAGQTVAGIVSAAAVVLVWTGVALALRRFGAWRRRRRRGGRAAPAVR